MYFHSAVFFKYKNGVSHPLVENLYFTSDKLQAYSRMSVNQTKINSNNFRDENGFKCHTMSEAHQRQLLIFAETPDKFLDSYSKEFEEGFVTMLKRTHGTKRVFANQVNIAFHNTEPP